MTHRVTLIAERLPDIGIVERCLQGLDHELTVHIPQSIEGTAEAVRGADVVLVYAAGMPKEVIAALDVAQAIVGVGHGFDSIDHEAATEHGVMVVNAADMCIEEVANHTLLLVLACSSRLLQLDALVKAGAWEESRDEKAQIGTVYDKTLGMVGFGNIAKATARRASGFRMELIAYDPVR